MRRRSFLQFTVATLAVAPLRAFAARPAERRKPLLIIVNPANGEAKWERGAAFGEYLNHGSDAQLAPLAAYEVLCAPMSEVRRLAPDVQGEPWLVAVDLFGDAFSTSI